MQLQPRAIDQEPVRKLLDRHLAHTAPFDITLDSLRLTLLPGVFCPSYTHTSSFLASHVRVEDGESVLDMFCGSGYQGLMAASQANVTVTCVDWSQAATQCAAVNAELNGLSDRVTAREGDLFAPVPGRFDVIVANPPLLPGTANTMLETSVFDADLIHSKRFLEQVRQHLTDTGRAYFLATDAHAGSGILDVAALAAAHRLDAKVIASRELPYEIYSVYELRPSGRD